MTPSKISVPLFLGIAGTIAFNLSPIALGYGADASSAVDLFLKLVGNKNGSGK